jgi:hypothetical protein
MEAAEYSLRWTATATLVHGFGTRINNHPVIDYKAVAATPLKKRQKN